MHGSSRIHRREINQISPRSRDHRLFLYIAGNLSKFCVEAWLDRGIDTSYDILRESHKSIFMRIEEDQGDEDLFSILNIPGKERCLFDE